MLIHTRLLDSFFFFFPQVPKKDSDKFYMRTQETKKLETNTKKVLVLKHDVSMISVRKLQYLGFTIVILNKGE